MELETLDDQDLALRMRMGGDIYERSEFHRGRLDRSGLGKSGIHHVIDLTKLPPMSLEDVKTPSSLLLMDNGASRAARLRMARRYAPLEWITAGCVPLAYSDDDLSVLGDLGSRLLRLAGASPSDVVASLVTPGATREHMQFSLGAQAAGISSISLGPGRDVEDIDILDPTILIGDAKELARVLDATTIDDALLTHVHTVILTGEAPTPRQYKRIIERLNGNRSAIVRAWAPDGTLALWGQCRGGTAFHTWPDVEVIEVVDPISGLPAPKGIAGHINWTGTGWYASAVVRLSTDVAVIERDDPCPTCGRRSPRLEPMEVATGFPEVLDASSHVKAWAAELQRGTDGDELVIWIAPEGKSGLLELVSELNLKIGPVQVHLVDEAEIEQRVEEGNGERYGDRRSF